MLNWTEIWDDYDGPEDDGWSGGSGLWVSDGFRHPSWPWELFFAIEIMGGTGVGDLVVLHLVSPDSVPLDNRKRAVGERFEDADEHGVVEALVSYGTTIMTWNDFIGREYDSDYVGRKDKADALRAARDVANTKREHINEILATTVNNVGTLGSDAIKGNVVFRDPKFLIGFHKWLARTDPKLHARYYGGRS